MSDAVPRGAMPPEHRNGTGVAAEEIVRLALEAVADRLDDLEKAVVGRTAAPPAGASRPAIDVDVLADRVAARLDPALAASQRAAAETLQNVERSGHDLAAGLDGLARRVAGLEQRVADDVARRPPLSADDVAASVVGRLVADRELSLAWDERVAASLSGHLDALDDRVGARIDALERAATERLAAVERAAAPAPDAAAEALAAVTGRLAMIDERLAGVERAVAQAPVDRTDEVEALVEETAAGLAERIAAVERAVRAVEVPDPAVAVRASLAPLADGLDLLRDTLLQRHVGGGGADAASLRLELDAALVPVSERVATLASAEGLTALADEIRDRLEEIAGAVEGRGDTARLIALLEERMSAVLRAVALRADAGRSAIGELAARLDRDEKAAEDVARAVRRLSGAIDSVPAAVAEAASETVASRVRTVGDRLDQLDARAARLEGLLGAQRADLDAVLAVRADVAALDRALGGVSADIAEMRLVADAWSARRQRG